MCQAGNLPRAAPSWASLLLPVLGGRKYQANSSVYDFKTSTSSAGCKMRMEEPVRQSSLPRDFAAMDQTPSISPLPLGKPGPQEQLLLALNVRLKRWLH